ncbi:aminotransferase IV [Fulvivirga sp. RKSG066]|uniref:aminotransferase class IV n=1 Tax=Fulvivirga aurantia TaxID=2529383 RepID=UPI0012BCAA50|nr:aminotransferase class IV [Fulvivirga aurantia]MTI23127.1 aminotransferase IV [Fulvivirga aurantia]
MSEKVQLPDERNADILININGILHKREDAKVSVFDSVVQGGDAVWEGIRVYNKKVFMLEEHLDRLMDSAKAMAFAQIPSRDSVRKEIFRTLNANKMYDEAHMRLTLTRGEKTTSGMSPHFNQSGPTLIILAEWKKPVYNASGIKLITSSIRRNSPQCVDSKIHHNNLINNILAKIEANLAGVDDAVMLDINGFVSETNATNIFFVKNGVTYTPFADSCLPGITRRNVILLARANDIPIEEKMLTIAEMYAADEAFVTGSMGELTPVLTIDGRQIGEGETGKFTKKFMTLYQAKCASEGVEIPEDII